MSVCLGSNFRMILDLIVTFGAELDTDWIHPWIGLDVDQNVHGHRGLGWIGSSKMNPCPTLIGVLIPLATL